MAPQIAHRPVIDASLLPDISNPEIDFHDTSFFQSSKLPFPQLPTPTAVFEQYPRIGNGVVKFEHLNLAVKVGQSEYLRLEEAQTMIAIRRAFPNHEVPVPEVFGWRKYGGFNLIYMSLIRGLTLREAWPTLTEKDKGSISSELGRIVAALRRAAPSSGSRYIGTDPAILQTKSLIILTLIAGSVNGGTVTDIILKLDYEDGPFHSIKSFNDWILCAATRQKSVPTTYLRELYRDLLPDSGDIFFTHGDLTLNNIIISNDYSLGESLEL